MITGTLLANNIKRLTRIKGLKYCNVIRYLYNDLRIEFMIKHYQLGLYKKTGLEFYIFYFYII